MPCPTGSYLLVRNKRYSLRLRIPVDLARHLGRVEIVRALGTSDRRAARFIAAGIALRLGLCWAMIKPRPALTPEMLRRLADDWLKAAVEEQWNILERGDFAIRAAPAGLDTEGLRAFSAEMFGRDASLTLDEVLSEASSGKVRRFDAEAGSALAAAGFGQRTNSQDRAVLRQHMLERFCDLQDAKVAWSEGDSAALPPQLVALQRSQAEASPGDVAGEGHDKAPSMNSRSIATAIDIFIAKMRQNKATEKHVIDAKSDLKLLVEAFGSDTMVGLVTPAHAGRLAEALGSLPAHFRSHPELVGLDLFAKATKARELSLPPLSFRSVNSYLVMLRNLFEQEKMAGYVSTNPFVGKRQRKPKSYVEQDRTWSPEELEKLFGSPLFQGSESKWRPYESGKVQIDDWRFWATLIAFFSGARISEIAQLRPRDIRFVKGIAVMDFNSKEGRTLKNQGTARQTPVHSRLEEIGLLRLAEQRRASNAPLLLPSMPAVILGDKGKAASQWMSERFLKRLELKNRAGLGFHAMRHTLKTPLRNAEVIDSVSNELCGHDARSARGVGAAYGLIELQTMKAGLEKIAIPAAMNLIKPRCMPMVSEALAEPLL